MNQSNPNLIWKSCTVDFGIADYIGKSISYAAQYPDIAPNFLLSSAACTCGYPLYKTIFHVGREFPIMTDRGPVRMKRVFTCPKCKIFYCAFPGSTINEGHCFKIALDQLNYSRMLKMIDCVSTTDGRSDV